MKRVRSLHSPVFPTIQYPCDATRAKRLGIRADDISQDFSRSLELSLSGINSRNALSGDRLCIARGADRWTGLGKV